MNGLDLKTLWPETCDSHWMSEEYEPGLVSVIVPTFNRSTYLVEAMDSVFQQTYRPIELIVVDDGSADNTHSVVEKWGSKHEDDGGFSMRYLVQKNAGAPAARNLGLIESRGEYIQFLDSDDLLHPEKLERHAQCLKEEGLRDFVYSGTGNFGEGSIDWDSAPYAGLPPSNAGLLADFLQGGMWNTLSGMYRRSACVTIGPWNEGVPIYQDWDYNIIFLLGEPQVKHVAGILSLARRDGKNRITAKAESEEILRVIVSLNIKWERLIRDAGKMEKKTEWAIAYRYYSLIVQALRHGFTDLAREIANRSSQLEANPTHYYKFAVWRFLACFPGGYGIYLARALFILLDAKNSIKRFCPFSCRLGANQP